MIAGVCYFVQMTYSCPKTLTWTALKWMKPRGRWNISKGISVYSRRLLLLDIVIVGLQLGLSPTGPWCR